MAGKLDPQVKRALIEELESDGYQITKSLPNEPKVTIPMGKDVQTFRFAVVACTHIGGKFAQPSLLKEFCRFAHDERGVTTFIHVGDMVNGSSRRHDYIYENHTHGASAQTKLLAKELPRFDDAEWWAIEGNHDQWYWTTEGYSVGEHLADLRPDVHFVGQRAGWFTIGPLKIYAHHGEGATSYALSYKPQKILEKIRPKPDLYFVANWHQGLYLPDYMGSQLFMAPCFQRQTAFERRLGLLPMVGGLILTLEIAKRGIWHVTPEWRIYQGKALKERDGW